MLLNLWAVLKLGNISAKWGSEAFYCSYLYASLRGTHKWNSYESNSRILAFKEVAVRHTILYRLNLSTTWQSHLKIVETNKKLHTAIFVTFSALSGALLQRNLCFLLWQLIRFLIINVKQSVLYFTTTSKGFFMENPRGIWNETFLFLWWDC